MGSRVFTSFHIAPVGFDSMHSIPSLLGDGQGNYRVHVVGNCGAVPGSLVDLLLIRVFGRLWQGKNISLRSPCSINSRSRP
jgi:hypothetical protein